MPDDFKLMVNGNYSSSYDDFSGTFKSVGAVNLSLQKQFLNQILSLSVVFIIDICLILSYKSTINTDLWNHKI